MDLVSYKNYQIILHRMHEKCTDLSKSLVMQNSYYPAMKLISQNACVDFHEITEKTTVI